MEPVSVLGAGSWGTALAWLLGEKGLEVRLWGRDPAHLAEIAERRENARYLPGLALPDPVRPAADLHAALSAAALVLVAVPTGAVRETVRAARGVLGRDAVLVLAAKGLESSTGKRLSQVSGEALGGPHPGGLAVLSGPNLAGEIVRGVPTATVVASPDPSLSRRLQEALGTPRFRVYTSPDLTGVELGGALKNPMAIAAGISDGIGFGSNTRAALLTRALAEMTRLGAAAGARPETFSGLSGLGDLLATAHSPLSRNYRLGLALGGGASLEQAAASIGQVVEGIPTTSAAATLAEGLGVEAPILQALHGVLLHGRPAADAVRSLMSRPFREEA